MDGFLSELEPLFESRTIKPTFEYVHVLLSLFIFGENSEGIGRYRLKEELQIGSGTARSLFNKLKDVSKFIMVPNEEKGSNSKVQRRGHILTVKGTNFLTKLKDKIPILEKANVKFLKEIIIEPDNVNLYFCLVKNAAKNIKDGIEQRDAAIKINGYGATCLIYNGKDIYFPTKGINIRDLEKIEKSTLNYFKTKIENANVKFEPNDVIIIGSGDNPQNSRLATLNAALTLF
ncbi:MAG: DUF4443 domain-containing protein [Candidatus Lokiarchaeota archaeon]|jgi:hypothetical protein|nr:DUF4443 domain-containing protein [Candidatus Lokiarchaeota archaeon]